MIDAYVLGSNEFVPVDVRDNGVEMFDAADTSVSIVKCSPGRPVPPPGSWDSISSIGDQMGFYTGTLITAGVYAVFVKIDVSPQVPILYVGRIQMY